MLLAIASALPPTPIAVARRTPVTPPAPASAPPNAPDLDFTRMTPQDFHEAAGLLHARGDIDRATLGVMRSHAMSAAALAGAGPYAATRPIDFVRHFRDNLAFTALLGDQQTDSAHAIYRRILDRIG